jgi:hypothetical protein
LKPNSPTLGTYQVQNSLTLAHRTLLRNRCFQMCVASTWSTLRCRGNLISFSNLCWRWVSWISSYHNQKIDTFLQDFLKKILPNHILYMDLVLRHLSALWHFQKLFHSDDGLFCSEQVLGGLNIRSKPSAYEPIFGLCCCLFPSLLSLCPQIAFLDSIASDSLLSKIPHKQLHSWGQVRMCNIYIILSSMLRFH